MCKEEKLENEECGKKITRPNLLQLEVSIFHLINHAWYLSRHGSFRISISQFDVMIC